MRFPKEYWAWERAGAPNLSSKPLSWRVRHVLHIGKPKPAKVVLAGVIRTAGNGTVDHEASRAFLAAGGTRILLQFRDPTNDTQNRAQLADFASRWRREGCRVDGWWRVNQSPSNTPPSVVGVDGWWPNAEDDDEIARLPEIYRSPCAGVLTKGKAPGAWPPPAGVLGAECFREGPESDHTVAESVAFWKRAGLPPTQLWALLQAYGTPFSPLDVQARQALELGVTTIAIYPLDGADPAAVRAVGEVFM